jgi:TctA family transporter
METFGLLIEGIRIALTCEHLFFCFVGVLLGTLVGALPGIGAVAAVAMLLPISYAMTPVAGIIFLAGVYYGSDYGGSISSILLNLPGTPSTVVTCLDGYPMTCQGRGGVALLLTALCSFIGAIMGILVLLLASGYLMQIARSFGSPEYFSLMLLGLVVATFINDLSVIKGLVMVMLGILLGLVGLDINTGAVRFTLGIDYLYPGLDLVVVAMGMFGVSELLQGVVRNQTGGSGQQGLMVMGRYWPKASEMKESLAPALRGGMIGSFFGALPGTGPTIASFVAYAGEKMISRRPEAFGKGEIAGISAPESANNAAAQTAFLPTLTLGIPGSATMAVMLAALTIHGITPGPAIAIEHPELFWGLIGSFLLGNIMLLVLNIPLIPLWIRIVSIRGDYLYPTMVVLICLGAYSLQNSSIDVIAVTIFGLAGLFFRAYGYPLAPFIIGFVLGPLMEENFRRTMRIADGNFAYFMERPIAMGLLFFVLLILTAPLIKRICVRIMPL